MGLTDDMVAARGARRRRYYELDPERLLATIARLSDRIDERFPGCGLAAVAVELEEIGKLARERMEWIARPIWLLRATTFVVSLFLVLAVVVFLANLRPGAVGELDFVTFVSLLEAGLNDLVMIAVGIFFLVTLEVRIKRRRALEALHELRSIAHVIDMHQLTKDPDRLLGVARADTAHSPRGELDGFELRRYLDYCSELLSLVGKVAALYVQRFEDAAAVAGVNEIEDLTTGLSRKIWQKITILQEIETAASDSRA